MGDWPLLLLPIGVVLIHFLQFLLFLMRRNFLILFFVSFQFGRGASEALISLCARQATAGRLTTVAEALFFTGDMSENIVSTLLNALILTITAMAVLSSHIM